MSTLLTSAMIEEAFAKTGVDRKYFPQYEAEVKSYYEGLTKGQVFDVGDDEEDEENYAEGSLDHADEYIKYYIAEDKKGHSCRWCHLYALYCCYFSISDLNKDVIDKLEDKEEKGKDISIYASSINKDPVFVERFKLLVEDGSEDSIEKAEEYCCAYHKCIEEGKSETYAHAYAEAVNDDSNYCDIYASAFEQANFYGMSNSEARMFGDCCAETYANAWFLGNKDFFYTFGEEWQKEYYLKLWCQRLEDDNHRELTDWEHQKYRDLLEKDIKCLKFLNKL